MDARRAPHLLDGCLLTPPIKSHGAFTHGRDKQVLSSKCTRCCHDASFQEHKRVERHVEQVSVLLPCLASSTAFRASVHRGTWVTTMFFLFSSTTTVPRAQQVPSTANSVYVRRVLRDDGATQLSPPPILRCKHSRLLAKNVEPEELGRRQCPRSSRTASSAMLASTARC